MLAAGVRKLPAGLPHAQRAMELANEDATMEMEHRTTYLATVGTLGPMIGLVGTVYGMIMAFRVIALEGSSPQASQLAAGISTALFATLEGIAISIPAIYFYSMFRNRIARLSLEVAMAAEPLLEQFAPGVRAQDPARRAAPAPADHADAHAHGRARRRIPIRSPSAPRSRPPRRSARTALPPAEAECSARLRAGRPMHGSDRGIQPAAMEDRVLPASPCQRCRSAMPRRRRTPGMISPNLTPLLDVVLQLITFFMMLVHFGTRLEGADRAVRLPVAPAALPGSDLTFDRLPVALDARGGLRVGGQVLEGAEASAWWAEQAKARRAGLELLRAGPGGPRRDCGTGTARARGATSCRRW